MGHADGDALTNKLIISGHDRLGVPLKVKRIPASISQPRKLSEGQNIPLHRDLINQIYICKTEICL